MIYAHSNDGNVQGALRYLEKMIIAKVTPGIETFNYTIRAHVRANDKDGAISSFNFFRNKFKLVPNVITMNMMIELNILNNDKGKSLSLLVPLILLSLLLLVGAMVYVDMMTDTYGYRLDKLIIRTLMKEFIKVAYNYHYYYFIIIIINCFRSHLLLMK